MIYQNISGYNILLDTLNGEVENLKPKIYIFINALLWTLNQNRLRFTVLDLSKLLSQYILICRMQEISCAESAETTLATIDWYLAQRHWLNRNQMQMLFGQ